MEIDHSSIKVNKHLDVSLDKERLEKDMITEESAVEIA